MSDSQAADTVNLGHQETDLTSWKQQPRLIDINRHV